MSEIVNSSLKTAAKGTTLAFLGIIANAAILLMVKILIARNITKEEFGIYSLIIAVSGVVSVAAGLGIHEGVSRFVAVSLGRKEDPNPVSSSSIQIGLLSGIVSFIALYFVSGFMAQYVFYIPEMATPLRLISFYIPFAIMTQLIAAVLRGHGIIKAKIFYLDILQPLIFLGLLCSIFIFDLPFISIIYVYLLSMIAVFAAIGLYGYRKISLRPFLSAGGNKSRELLKFSVPVLGVSLLGIVLMWTDTLMLGRYAGAAEVGSYNVSITLALLLTFPLGALVFVFMPLAGEMYAKDQMSELNRTNFVLTKWIFSASFPIFFVLFFFPEMTLTFLFGTRFSDSAMPLRILSLGFLLHSLLGTNGVLMMVFNMTKALMYISLIGAVLHLAVSYIFLKMLGYGIPGAAAATVISYLLLDIIASVILYKKSGIHPYVYKYIKPVLGSSAIGLIIYIIAKSIPLHAWMLPVYFILFVAGYILSMFMSRNFDKEDIFLLDVITEKTGLKLALAKKIICRFGNK